MLHEGLLTVRLALERSHRTAIIHSVLIRRFFLLLLVAALAACDTAPAIPEVVPTDTPSAPGPAPTLAATPSPVPPSATAPPPTLPYPNRRSAGARTGGDAGGHC